MTGIAWHGAKAGDIGYDILGKPVILGVGSPAFYNDKYGQSELEEIYRCSNCKRLYVSISHKKCDCPMKSTPLSMLPNSIIQSSSPLLHISKSNSSRKY